MPKPKPKSKSGERRGGRSREDRDDRKGGFGRKQRRKVCQFCRDKSDWVDYKDTQLLRKFVSDRGKIRARRVTGTCSQHQRDVATAVKNAREMGLVPYAVR